jgi:hypothetical protein
MVKDFTWQTGNPLQISTASLPNGYIGYDYAAGRVQVAGGVGQISFYSLGDMPPGLNLIKETGVIGGKPSVAGFSNIVIYATDSATPTQQATTQTMSIRISSELPVSLGDIDGNGSIDLEDAIRALRIISNIHVDNLAVRNTINRKVGLADVIYILQWLSLSRSN